MQKKTPTQSITNTSNAKASLAMRLVCLFWIAAKLIGWRVWLKERLFPVAPVFEWCDWPAAMHYILFVCSLGAIALLFFKPFSKTMLIALVIVELLSCIADQNRWQPWQYQYLFTAVICLINFKEAKKTIGCIAFVMAATYLYSGIGKLNEGYLVLVWDNIFLKKIFKLSEAAYQANSIHYLGYATAVTEIFVAIGLFFAKTKKAAAYGMIAMHLLILYAIGPLGINYNSIVWPWNVLMIILLYILFIKNEPAQINFNWLWQGWNKLVLVCWGIMPALNYAGLWDSYLSSRLYSGGLPLMVLCVKDGNEKEELQPYFSKTDTYNLCNGDAMANLQTWAMKEMNVPPYPELRVYKKAEGQWRKSHPNTTTGFVYYYISRQKEAKRIENK